MPQPICIKFLQPPEVLLGFSRDVTVISIIPQDIGRVIQIREILKSVIQTKEYFVKAHVDELKVAIIESQGTEFTIILPLQAAGTPHAKHTN